jgi:hypothetical protein
MVAMAGSVADGGPRSDGWEEARPAVLDATAGDHLVHFYEDERCLTGVVVDFLVAGAAAGEPLVVIATAAHRAAFLDGLEARGVAPDALLASGQLTLLDASATLASLMVDGVPDPARFDAVIGGQLARIGAGAAQVRAYGEMVDLLWSRGERQAALRLEELWNELASRHRFSLLCAYVMASFLHHPDRALLEQVCRCHPRSGGRLLDTVEASRQVAALHRRAVALEREVQARVELERARRADRAAAPRRRARA